MSEIKILEYWKDDNGHVWSRVVLGDVLNSEKIYKVFHIDKEGDVTSSPDGYIFNILKMTMPNGVKYTDLPIKQGILK